MSTIDNAQSEEFLNFIEQHKAEFQAYMDDNKMKREQIARIPLNDQGYPISFKFGLKTMAKKIDEKAYYIEEGKEYMIFVLSIYRNAFTDVVKHTIKVFEKNEKGVFLNHGLFQTFIPAPDEERKKHLEFQSMYSNYAYGTLFYMKFNGMVPIAKSTYSYKDFTIKRLIRFTKSIQAKLAKFTQKSE